MGSRIKSWRPRARSALAAGLLLSANCICVTGCGGSTGGNAGEEGAAGDAGAPVTSGATAGSVGAPVSAGETEEPVTEELETEELETEEPLNCDLTGGRVSDPLTGFLSCHARCFAGFNIAASYADGNSQSFLAAVSNYGNCVPLCASLAHQAEAGELAMSGGVPAAVAYADRTLWMSHCQGHRDNAMAMCIAGVIACASKTDAQTMASVQCRGIEADCGTMVGTMLDVCLSLTPVFPRYKECDLNGG